MAMKRWIAWILGLIQAAALSAQAEPLSTGQHLAETFLRGNVEEIWTASTAEMRAAFGSVDALAALREDLDGFGTEEAVLSESVERQAGHDVFTRRSRWSGSAAPLELVIALDGEERIAGFFIRPQPVAAPSPHLDYRTRARLRLPVEGEWFVYWGGREIEDNYHAADAGQRFALDLLVLRDGQSHAGDPSALDSYHCWGRPILAPAEGVVVAAVDGLPDQPIGSADPANPAGNHVVIDFGNGEYGFLAHLRRNSLRVAVDDRVAAGQEIGSCRNSGNTSEPHLHFHLQTSPRLGTGEGLPAQFTGYLANGVPVERGEPRKGETIRSAD
ncbi:M23 family metallopeptidase [Rhodobacter sp. SGA-6-6]|nr:M23 family metallopeptidase [Rhodobacter sp. SGA-6-6]